MSDLTGPHLFFYIVQALLYSSHMGVLVLCLFPFAASGFHAEPLSNALQRFHFTTAFFSFSLLSSQLRSLL